jgi:hypothetical protein
VTAASSVLSLAPEAVRAAVERACASHEVLAEACWHRDDERAEVVVGLVGAGGDVLEAFARAVVPAHAERVAAWLASTDGIEDVGFKVGHRGVQLYARGELTIDGVARGLTAASVDVHATALRNLLVLFAQPTAAMVGLELDGDAIDGALYVSVPRTPEDTPAVRDAFGLLVRVAAPDQLDVWNEVAPTLFRSPEHELVYVSMSTALDRPWAKLDVGPRPVAIAAPLITRMLGSSPAPVLDAIRRHGDELSHVGVRFGGGMGPSFYLALQGAGAS